jgi:streptogramin lyase
MLPRGRQRMNVATAPNGTVTITPDEGQMLYVLGDPAMGEVVEVPAPAQPVQ